MHEYENLDAPAHMLLNFQLAVLELEMGKLMPCLAAVMRMPEAATGGSWTDLFDCVHYGWLLVAHVVKHWQGAEGLAEKACWHIVETLQDYRSSATAGDMRDAALFPTQAFSILAGLLSLREAPDQGSRLQMARAILSTAAKVDAETDGEYGFTSWLETRLSEPGFGRP